MDQFFEEMFGREHHEVQANKFAISVRELAKKFPDLEIVVRNMTDDEIDLGPEMELAAYLDDGNYDLADKIREDNVKAEANSANQTTIGVIINGDDKNKIEQAVGLHDDLALKYRGLRVPDTGKTIENSACRLAFLGPGRENLLRWTNGALYEFKNTPGR